MCFEPFTSDLFGGVGAGAGGLGVGVGWTDALKYRSVQPYIKYCVHAKRFIYQTPGRVAGKKRLFVQTTSLPENCPILTCLRL